MPDAELGGEALPEGADTEGLRRVVPGCEEVEPGLACVVHRRLARLARDEGVQAGRDRVVEMLRGAAGDDADRRNRVRAREERERLAAAGGVTHASAQLLGRDLRQTRAHADAGERL